MNRSHWLPNKLQYPFASVRALATYRPVALTLDIDGNRSEHRAANVVIANSRFYGKGMAIAPDAAIDDGQLDVIVIEAAGRLDLIRALPKVYDGAHVELDAVKVLRGTRVTVSGRYAGTGAARPGRRRRRGARRPPGHGADPLASTSGPGRSRSCAELADCGPGDWCRADRGGERRAAAPRRRVAGPGGLGGCPAR